MDRACITLRPMTRAELPVVQPWFEDPDTSRFLGGPDWPAKMLDHATRRVGETFRGAVQTGSHHYLAFTDNTPVGYIDCGTFDRCTVYGGEGPDGPILLDTIDAVSGAVAFVVDRIRRGDGLATQMLRGLTRHPDLATVEPFEAGVEPDNRPSRYALEAAGFVLASLQPDFEGMLYYRGWRQDLADPGTASA